jgi:8-oxo-dGTP diphosphatase
MEKKHYVVGLVFDTAGANVLLMRKQKPAWQVNKLNGPGGKIEAGETALAAIIREFKEEVFVNQEAPIKNWQLVCELKGEWGSVFFYAAYVNSVAQLLQMTAAEGEPVVVVNTSFLPQSCVPNLRWIIPMALSLTRGETANHFIVQEQRA